MRSGELTSGNTWTNSRFAADEERLPFFRFGKVDHVFLITALAIAAFGVVMVYSSSYIYAQERFGDGLYYLRRHVVFLAIGLVLMSILRFIDYRRLRPLAIPAMALSLLTMIMVMIPGLGSKAGGATRWLDLGIVRFQPVEFAKVAIVFFMAAMLSSSQFEAKDWRKGFAYHLLVPLLLAGLCMLQPDFGSAALVIITSGIMLYMAGARLRYLGASVLVALPVFYFFIMSVPYRRARLMTFLDPWADPQNSGFQIIQSFLAFHRGGLFGVGLGNSKEKLFYLPEAHNDFILAVVGEELGFIGIVLICFAFVFLLFRAMRISARAEDGFGSMLAGSLAVLLGLEVFLNAGIVLGLLPTKGMNMPFISSGGSSIVAAMLIIGLILSISARSDTTDSSSS